MSVFGTIARVSFLVAALCSIAFADNHTGRFSDAADQGVSRTSDIQLLDAHGSDNFTASQVGLLRPHLAPHGGEALLTPKPRGENTPAIRLLPVNKSQNIAEPQAGALEPHLTLARKDVLLPPDLLRSDAPSLALALKNKLANPTPLQLASLTSNVTDSAPPLRSTEPFGLPTASDWLGNVSTRWAALQSRIRNDERTLAACRSDTALCSKAVRHFLSILTLGRQREGLSRLGWINRAVNLRIRPMSDWVQYGYADYWASPLQTLGSEAGDCEDYAIVKYAVLRDLGISPTDLRLVIVQDGMHHAVHAVLAVHDDDKWLVLDNRTMMITDASQDRQYYPLFVMDYRGARAFSTKAAHR
jgi:predicted transglutaminase-like cysteine proteinase